jgi:hypothetical protein
MAKNCIIYETMTDVKSMDVKKTADGLMHLSGVFGVCGVVNNNKRVYEKENYAQMVKNLQERIANEGCPGEMEHPDSMNINLENVSHKIDSISIDENGVVSGEITLLNTPKGKIAQAIIEGGLPLFVSSRARGTVGNGGKVTLEELKTYDLVGSAGFSQAKMHLREGRVAEQLNESVFYTADAEEAQIETANETNENNMEEKKLLEKIEALESRVEELESRPTVEQIAEGVQNWIVNEYTPIVEKWSTENLGESFDKKQFCDAIENWIKEEYAPVLKEEAKLDTENSVKEWVANEYSELVEKWIAEEHSETLEKWMLEQLAPEFEKWIKEEYTPTIQNWIVENYSPVIDKWVKNEIKESKKTTLSSIDETLALLEGSNEQKPKYGRKQILTESTENDEPKFIREMPQEARVKWNLASEDVKEAIRRRAKVYNFVNEASIEAFWNNINFEEVKPAASIYEGLENIQDERERAIRASLLRFANRF